jgi:3D (Asp-Asp-Asp) domain-containing protein
MRIISKLMVALALLAVVLPQIALAAENADTNETQTKFKIQENIQVTNGLVYDETIQAPYNYPGYEPVKTSDELKREAMAEKYKNLLASANFPQGKFVLNASAYTAAADECGKSNGITASGVKVMENRTLACPPQFPFGTKIQIDGMGTFVCEDRGGAIKGNHVDIYMETKAQAFAFGRRNLEAEIVLD